MTSPSRPRGGRGTTPEQGSAASINAASTARTGQTTGRFHSCWNGAAPPVDPVILENVVRHLARLAVVMRRG
jgi:hypothetical protein